MTYHKARYAFPTWLPVDGPPWRLVDHRGAFLRDPDGDSVRFQTEQDALDYLEMKDIPLVAHGKDWSIG